jgi:CheY-like chemotaxis protein
MSDIPKVLIVDYEPKAIKALSDLLGQSGYVVDIARDGITALTMFKDGQPDIVLLEAMIPKKHGFEVCQEIKKSPPGKDTPVIIMTAVYKGRKHRTQAMHVHGCDEYVEKPCTPESILEIVKRFVPPGDVGLALAVGENKTAGAGSPERLGEVIPFPAGRTSYTLTEMDDETEREIMSKLDEILPDTPMFNERGTDTEVASADAALVDFDLDTETPGTAETRERTPGGSNFSMDPPSVDPAKRALLSKTSIVIIVIASILTLLIYVLGKV